MLRQIEIDELTMFPALVAGGKVSEVAGDATSVHPSLRKATHYVGFTQGWETDTPFEVRDLIRRNMTEQTQALARLIPEFGSYHNEYVYPYINSIIATDHLTFVNLQS